MLFVALLNAKPNWSTAQSMQRRVEWKAPAGIKRVAEYWLQHNTPRVITIFEADNIASIMAATGPWTDLFEITVVPAITSEEGLKIASQTMPKP